MISHTRRLGFGVLAVACALILASLIVASTHAAQIGPRYEAEAMSESSPDIEPIAATDTIPAHLRFLNSADGTSADRASKSVSLSQQVNEIRVSSRQNTNTDVMAVWVDGSKVGTWVPSNADYSVKTINLASPISASSHNVAIGHDSPASNRVGVDWVELHGATTEPTPTPTPEPTPEPSAGTVAVGTGSASACDKIVQPGSSSLQSAASSDGARTVCLRDGVYGGLGVQQKISGSGSSDSNRLVVKSYPGETAEIRGQLTFSNASYLTLRDMYFDNRYQPYSAGGGTTNDGNPDMTPVLLMGGSHVDFFNNEVDGGNGDSSAANGTRPFNQRSTCVGYRDPNDEHFVGNWVHNCGVLAKFSKSGDADGHGIYFSNASGSGPHSFNNNVLWGIPANAIDLHGMKVGPTGYDVMNNIVFASSNSVDMNNQNRDSHIAHNIFIDPDGEPIRYDQGQGTNIIEDNCLNGGIKVDQSAGLVVRNNVTDRSASVSGTPKSSSWSISASSACMDKYQGTMYQ